MVLVTHHAQSSYVTIPIETLPSSKRLKLKHNGIRFQMVSRDGSISLKHACSLRPVSRCVHKVKVKSLQISAFKGNTQSNEGGEKSKSSKTSVKISNARQVKDESLSEPPATHDLSVSYASESEKTVSGSKAIRKLFKKWLNILHTGAPNEPENEILEGTSQEVDLLQDQKVAKSEERGEISKAVLCYFLGLDASVTIPLIIFVPVYLAINVMYGAEVLRELTPLWIIGPLIVAVYVKLLRGIISLYVFSFKQTVKVIKNLPMSSSITSDYLLKGKLKDEIRARFLQPLIDFKNADYKELSMRKWKAFREWLTEKYLDYVESIWPFYCRTIRFLKSANLI